MNKTKIEWCDYTWNPITGCRHGCPYCYAKKVATRYGKKMRDFSGYPEAHGGVHCLENKIKDNPYPYIFEPTFLPFRLKEPEQKTKPQTIFVCSMADLFGSWVPDKWIEEVFAACERAPQHRYLFFTKNPSRYSDLHERGILPCTNNIWYGVTATNAEQLESAAAAAGELPNAINVFLSAEPLHCDLTRAYAWELADFGGYFDWIIIGAETGNRKEKVTPRKEWIDDIGAAADNACVPVFMKDSIIPIVGEENMRRELPWEVERK